MEEAIVLDAYPSPPSLLCFTVMRGASEEALVLMQLEHRASLFACDDAVVFSNGSRVLGLNGEKQVSTWNIPVPAVSTTSQVVNGRVQASYTNAAIFVVAWDALLNQGALIWSHDWVVKVDPDTVFFPDRLRLHVSAHQDTNTYFTNCQPEESTYPRLFGSLEVFSKEAMKTYSSNKWRCTGAFDMHNMSESSWMMSCLDTLGVGRIFDSSLLGDSRCSPADCSDWTRVSFHPYKDVSSWSACLDEASSGIL